MADANTADSGVGSPAGANVPAADAKVAMITGCNSGVGLALVVAFAKRGFLVWATMRTPSKAESLREQCSAAGVMHRVTIDQCDVSSCDSVTASVARMLAKHGGRVDVLVNNAAYGLVGNVECLSMEAMQASFNTNVFGVIRCTKAVLPSMRGRRAGHIINISSINGNWGSPFKDMYCASKFAVEGLGESWAPLLRCFGIHVTQVGLGATRTNFGANIHRPDPAAVPEEYGPLLGFLGAKMRSIVTNPALVQSAEEVAELVLHNVVEVAAPPFRYQPNPAFQHEFDMQLADPTGEAGVRAASAQFLPPVAGHRSESPVSEHEPSRWRPPSLMAGSVGEDRGIRRS